MRFVRTPAVLFAASMSLSAHAVVPPSLHVPAPIAQQELRMAAPAGQLARPVLRVGEAVPVALDIAMGTWTLHDDGSAEWALRLLTDDATHIGLMLENSTLPEGAHALLQHGDDDTPGTWVAAQRDATGRLWFPAQPGATAVLRIILPSAEVLHEVRLADAEVHYGTRDVTARLNRVGTSGNCHNNVVCPQGADWGASIRASARVVIGGQLLCSAVLLNNTASDGDPLLLTADHCGIGDGINRFPAESVTALFNFQSSACSSDRNVSDRDTLAGSELLYRDTLSDTALIRLNAAPPASFGAVYAGWDASGNGAGSGAGVHHPSGDVKKISLFSEPLSMQRVIISDGGLRNQTVESWRVNWSDGVTEPGSSGSGLWNPQRRVIGVLSGGGSECPSEGGGGGLLGGLLGGGGGGSSGALGPDFYGRLDVAWDRPGALGTPLRAFLDPSDSAQRSIDGRASDGGVVSGAGRPVGGGSSGGGSGWLWLGGMVLTMLGRRLPRRLSRT